MTAHSTSNRPIGSAVERLEDMRFLRGRGEYVDDVPAKGALHAVILRSPVAHGRIRTLDPSAALKCPGVRAVITARDIGDIPVITMRQELLPEFKPYQQPVIAKDKVRYVGEPLAVVVADSAALAEDALEHIALDIEALPPVADRAAARRRRQPAVRGRLQSHPDADGRKGRRRGGIQGRALHPPRKLLGAALHRRDHGAAWSAGRMGCGQRPSHRVGHDQGRVPQPPAFFPSR